VRATLREASLFASSRKRCATALVIAVGAAACARANSFDRQDPVGVTQSAPLPKTPELPPADAGEEIDARSAVLDATVLPQARLVELGLQIKEHDAPHLRWRQVENLNWQAIATASELTAAPTAQAPCEAGMQLIQGNALVDASGSAETDRVEALQDSACTEWRVPKRICGAFSETKWQTLRQELKTVPRAVCMDTYEYPNRKGEYPLTVVTYAEANAYCTRENKRICTETEWTFACEGEEGRPYPYGYARDAKACPIDRPRIEPPEDTFIPRTMHRTALGIDQMWQGERSGDYASCVSPFGVHDMTGNVDEWTRSVRKWGYPMILKGGHWSYVRGRCRPQTRGHGPRYVNVETGFRCCKDVAP
jgi:formylglycine-generating enzyme